MSKVDKRIVSMEFNDGQFQKGAQNSIRTLDKLKQSLNLDKAGKGLDNLQKSAGRFTLGGLESAANGITAKFSALGVVGVTALTNIANKAVNAGAQLLKSLTLDPIMDGFKEYETKMGSVQTILANTRKQGTTLSDVTKTLGELNKYSDKTIYSFADMTKNIGLFTNAGLGLEESASMIKGFSNEAAASGTTAEGAAHAAYQLSQALSAGQIRLMDWRSLTNAGMGNANMKNGLIEIADAMGVFNGEMDVIDLATQDFNASLEKGWLTSDVMSKYLQIMAGDLDAAAMKTMGLTDAQIASFQAQQKTAEDSATMVRTWTQLVGTLAESVGSGWAQTFELLFGDFNEATYLWTSLNNVIGPFITHMSDARNETIQMWKALGGRTAMFEGIKNIFKALGSILGPIGKAFSAVFQGVKVETLVSLSKGFQAFTEKLILSESASKKVEEVFRKVFEAVKALGAPIHAVVMALVGLVSGVTPSATKILGTLTDNISGLVSWLLNGVRAFSDWANSTDVFARVSDTVSSTAKFLANAIESISGFLSRNIFAPLATGAEGAFGKVSSGATSVVGILSGVLSTISEKINDASAAVSGFFDSFGRGKDEAEKVEKAFNPISAIFGAIGKAVGGVISWFGGLGASAIDFGGLLAKIPSMLTKAFAFVTGGALAIGFMKIADGIRRLISSTADIKESVTGILDGVTGALKGMQQNLQAKALLNIAFAVAVLAGSLLLLSLIPADKAMVSTGIMTALIANLVGALAGITHFTNGKQIAEMNGVAASMIIMALAMSVLASAVKKIASLSGGELAKGIAALEALTIVMATMSKILTKNAPQMQVASKSILRFSISVFSLAFALKAIAKALAAFKDTILLFGELDTGVLIKGLIGLAATFAILMLSIRAMPEQSEKASFAMVLMATSVKMVADVVERFGSMPLGQLVKGLFGMGAAMALMAGTLNLVPKDLGAKAGSLILAAVAMNILSGALKIIGSMDMGSLAKGLIGMTLALAAIAGGLYLMTGSIAGAAALTIAAIALNLLIPVLTALAVLPAENIAKGLLALVGLFAAIGVSGMLLAPLVPVLLGVGVALALMGVALFLGATAFAALVIAITALATAGVAGIGLILTAVTGLLTLLPLAGSMVGLALIAMAKSISTGGPAIMAAITTILTAVIDAAKALLPQVVELIGLVIEAVLQILVENVPKLVEMIILLVDAILEILVDAVPKIVEAALDILVALLESIRDHIGDVVTLALEIVTEFVTALGSKLGEVAEAGVQLVTDLLNAIGDTARNSGPELGEAGRNLVSGIVAGILAGLAEFWEPVINGIRDAGNKLIDAFKEVLGIHSPSTVFMGLMSDVGTGIVNGIQNFVGTVVEKGRSMARSLIDGVKSFFGSNSSDSAKNFINGVLSSIGGGVSSVVTKAKNLGRDAVNGIKNFFSSNSGSSAKNFIDGVLSSIGGGIASVVTKAENLARDAISGAKNWFASNSGKAGRALIDGIIGGIDRGIQSVKDAAGRVARAALDAANRVLGIHSPSREFAKIGSFAVDGFTGALDRGGVRVERSSENMANTSMDAVRKAFDDIVGYLNLDNDVVITPSVDLTEAEKAADALRNLLSLDARSSYSTAAVQNASGTRTGASDGRVGEELVGAGSVTFVQNNNSPAALSTSDIYRQTKNLVSRTRR